MIDFNGDGHIDNAEEALFFDMATGDDDNEYGSTGSSYSSGNHNHSNNFTGEEKLKIFIFILLILYCFFVHN